MVLYLYRTIHILILRTPGLVLGYIPNTKKFTIYATEPPNDKANGLKRMLYLEMVNPILGQNNFNDTNYVQVIISVNFQLDKVFQTNNSSSGTLNITRFDTNAKIISGTFSFDAVQRDSTNNIVHVTDGRFDVTYK